MKKLTVLTIIMVLISCHPDKKPVEKQRDVEYIQPKHHSTTLTNVFNAHGGFEQWSKMKSLSYLKGEERTVTNLQNRKIRLESPKQTIGFDGAEVWITPDSVDASRARFYHNLYFYFFAMPFVVGDPGAYYEDLEPRELDGKIYNGVKVSFHAKVGYSPDDNYVIWYDPSTNKMQWLMYTVTYKTGAPSDTYKLIKYRNWSTFNGLLLPTSIQWFQYDGEKIGEARGKATSFENIQISEDAPDEKLFEKPETARTAPHRI